MNFDISTLVTDRTALDVTRKTAKGQYNSSDLNRIENAMSYVGERLEALGYDVQINLKANWSDKDWPNAAQAQQYLANLAELRNKIAVYKTTPLVPASMEQMTYGKANAIEKILMDLDAVILQTWRSVWRANAPEFYAGSEPLPTSNVYKGRTWKELDALNLTWDDWNNATFFQLLYGAFGARTWADLDALALTWADWNRFTFLALAYKKF